LWGQIRVQVAGLILKDAQGRKLISVKNSYFHIPFSSVFGGSPLLTFKMDRPEVNLVKSKSGKLNAMTLMKEGAAPADTAQSSAGQPSGGGGAGDVALPRIATRARLGVELRDALVSYKDEATD